MDPVVRSSFASSEALPALPRGVLGPEHGKHRPGDATAPGTGKALETSRRITSIIHTEGRTGQSFVAAHPAPVPSMLFFKICKLWPVVCGIAQLVCEELSTGAR